MLTDPPPADSALLRDARTNSWLLFERPLEIVCACRLSEVVACLETVEAAVNERGLYAAGFVAYEAAPAFDPALTVRPDAAFPLLWFGLYGAPRAVDLPPALSMARAGDERVPSMTPDAYAQAFARVKGWIREGETYQVNLSYRLTQAFREDPWPLFLRLAAAQKATFGAYVATRDWTVCCASPELFFSLEGARLESRPMKGTAPRGVTLAQDRGQAAALLASEKDRAENLMIVDMVRSDLGRIAEPGSVTVPNLFTLEKYPTVWQMTSTICAETQAPLSEIFRALFPAASITGAPKGRTMELIAEAESAPRRIYTGSLGFIAPGRRAQFNVAIRTLLIDHAHSRAEYGVGGGIVWDSVCGGEQAECRAKARILDTDRPPFALLETMLWLPAEGYALLERHLTRLSGSAEYFDFSADLAAVRQRLRDLARGLPPAPHKVRLLVAQDGAIALEAEPVSPASGTAPLRVALARAPVDRGDPFLYHKTTRRTTYAEALASRPGFDDVMLFNADNEVTESTRMNVAAELDGALWTPPVSCGLLPGTFRTHLLETGAVRERIITRDELLRSPRVFLFNSVRGMLSAAVTA